MDDRAVSILDNYELKVFRTWKGRGSLLCETDQGLKILKEYIGPKEKILLQDNVLLHMKTIGFEGIEQIIRNKEEELISTDQNQVSYLLKDYFEGKECNSRNEEECKLAMGHLAHMHQAMQMGDSQLIRDLPVFSLDKEYSKHNKELKKAKNYLKNKGQKTNFERFLLKEYDRFYKEAIMVSENISMINTEKYLEQIKVKGSICHGDYQYHNIITKKDTCAVINFEKCLLDSPVRDIYLFMRKVLEKCGWSQELGKELLDAYESVVPLTKEEHLQLKYRFLYPDKFWKIVNFYFNSGKYWISGRNNEKLTNLLNNTEAKQNFLKMFEQY